MFNTISAHNLLRAAQIKEQIESLEAQLHTVLNAQDPRPAKTGNGRRGKMSPAGRARIIAAQKARWAKQKPALGRAVKAKRPRRKMSAAARAKLATSARARWIKAKAAGKTTL